MNPVLSYLLESAICLALFYAFYEFVQKRERTFRYNRLYLITTFLLSLILPAIKITLPSQVPVISSMAFNNIIQLPELTMGTESAVFVAEKPFNWPFLLLALYFSGAAFFMGKFLIGLYKIVGLISISEKFRVVKYENATIIPTQGKFPSCSFFNYIFWDGAMEKDVMLNSQVFQHELAHVRYKHTWDILLLEISSIVFWFNPLIHFFKQAIKEVHEYIVDAEIAKSTDKDQYIQTLASQSLLELDLSLIHPFNKSQIIKRINMLEKSWKKSNWMKMALIVPLVATMALVFSCQTESFFDSNHMTQLPEGWKIMNQTEVDDIVQTRIAKLKEEYPGYDFYPVKFTSGKIENGNPFWLLRFVSYENKVGVGQSFPSGNSPMKDRRNIEEVQFNENSNDGNVFTVVEEQPVPEGGMRAFYDYVQKELKYPEQAKNQGIEGRVYIQFVVDRDGSITDVQTIRGIGGGCDEEAVRVIASSPKWAPGKQQGETVKVRMILPMPFSIGPKITENGQYNIK